MKETIQGKFFFRVGLLFILIGVLCNEWVLAALFSSDSSIVLSRRIVIWIFDLIMIASGTALIMKRETLNGRLVMFYLLMVFMSLLAVETVLNVIYYAAVPRHEKGLEKKPYLLPAFEGKEWAKGWFQERSDINIVYKPFRMWGNKKYKGEYINLDSEGHRKTWNPESFQGKPKKIYILGGSTTWGYGARDDHTIPSYISKKLHEKGYDFEVYNFGEFAYTYPQEIITLVLLLRNGHRPDYVITYDGINDGYSAYQAGKPGALSNQFLMHKRLEKMDLSNTGHIKAVINNILENYSKIYMGFKKMEQMVNAPDSDFQEVAHFYDDEELKELSSGIVENYARSLELLDALSKTYNFKYICFWQPHAITEDELLDGEKDVDVRLKDKTLGRLFKYTNNYIDRKSFPHFYDISGVLHGRKKPYYFDWMHITEEGNEVVAGTIVSIFEKTL